MLCPLSYQRCYTRNFTSEKSDVYVLAAAARRGFKMVLRPTAAATRGFTMVLFTEAVSEPSKHLCRMRSNECPSSFGSFRLVFV